MHPVTIRLANGSDAAALRRVAELDSRPPSPGPHLVAVREGRIDAAISLATGEVAADPFRHTAEVCELLRCAARRRRVRGGRLVATRRRPRAAWAPT